MGKSIYDLREMLCEELENITEQRSLSGEKLKMVDMLTHSIKSIDTIIAMEEGGYSSERGGSYGSSYERGGNSRDNSYNSYVRRDSRGRYSRTDGKEHLMHQLEDMMRDSNDKERDLIKRFMDQMGM